MNEADDITGSMSEEASSTTKSANDGFDMTTKENISRQYFLS